ncbi:hypothetical protein FE783_14000 [Paenibacillus mesophilus]|uniref:hypothetical protein n=1 Tax=Paenibacillus mesophilus TaxID=2582849 RepID=UPI00110F17D9|nr:hypothetical protein [Paenibacillus mesophilus]TMV49604.1 hypothetical protein FE783_14000 [Paenibacillus mesophilus]
MLERAVEGELSRMKRTPVQSKPPESMRRIPAQGDVVLICIALCYVLLGIMKSVDLVVVAPAVIASFSLAGMFFALSDLAKIGIRWSGRIAGTVYLLLYYAFLLGSALCLIVVPLSYGSIGWLGAVIVPLGDVSTFAGMGVIIGIIVFNNVWRRARTTEPEKTIASGER